jgi:hypothetical protein
MSVIYKPLLARGSARDHTPPRTRCNWKPGIKEVLPCVTR